MTVVVTVAVTVAIVAVLPSQRHVDMMVNPAVRDVFRMRAKVTSFIRRSLDDDDFLEVIVN